MAITDPKATSENSFIHPPRPEGRLGGMALKNILKTRSILSALELFHNHLGDIFQIDLPGFKPVIFSGPEANRFVLVTQREELLWRVEPDPVVELLGRGLLVEDGTSHDQLRSLINPAMHRRMLDQYLDDMILYTDQISDSWKRAGSYDMLVEMRKIALLVLVSTMFSVDMTSDLDRMWSPILKILKYISPGLWMVWRGVPRLNYRKSFETMDDYLYRIIQKRRIDNTAIDDLLGGLMDTHQRDNELVRDQMLTMLIAGHDTSTAMLAWALYLLGTHPDIMQLVSEEVDRVLGDHPPSLKNIAELDLLNRVIKETLRLYPPIHAGNRIVKTDIKYKNIYIPSGSRLIYSIYLTHRQPEYWPNPGQFDPDRFTLEKERARPAYSYIPFGGGPRNCIGAGFAQIEGKVILARLLQKYNFHLVDDRVHPLMGATLEPNPGVFMQVRRRS